MTRMRKSSQKPMAIPANRLWPCGDPNCNSPNSYTWFVRWHPFNDRMEIRRCFRCGQDSCQSVDYYPEKAER